MTEWNSTESLCEDSTKLVFGVNLDNTNVTGTNLFTKPMIFDGIVLGARSHTFWFQVAESKSTNIVFINGGVEIGVCGDRKANCFTELMDLIKKWE